MLMNTEITFEGMANRFGEVIAYQYLEQIERAADMQPQRSVNSPELRLAIALRAQDEMWEPALLKKAA